MLLTSAVAVHNCRAVVEAVESVSSCIPEPEGQQRHRLQ